MEFRFFSGGSVSIVQADLCRETTDAILCPVMPSFKPMLKKDSIQRAIIKAGGAEGLLQAQTRAIRARPGVRRFPVGYTVVSGAGGLPCKRILNVVSMDFVKGRHVANERTTYKIVKAALSKAKHLGLESISIPAVGTKHFGATVADTIRGSFEAVREHYHRGKTPVRQVRLVYFGKKAMMDALSAAASMRK